MALLEVEGLRVEFPTPEGPVRAVRGVSFSVEPGETVAIVGESGGGKTAAMHALLRLLPRRARVDGSVRLLGRDLLRAPERELQVVRGREIAIVFQDPLGALNPTMRVGAQVAEAAAVAARLAPRAAAERAVRLLERVALPDGRRVAGLYPHQLSGGMRQRVLIALALAARPRLLIADEPTAALDATVAARILDLLVRLREEDGLGVLLVTHDLGAVARLADRVHVMYAGQVVESGTVEDVLCRPAHPYTRALLRSLPAGHGPRQPLLPVPGQPPDPGALPEGCAFAPRCARAMRGCGREEPPCLPVPGDTGHTARCWLHDPQAPAAAVGPPGAGDPAADR